ncbi:hypothetical protein ACFX1S_043987 [Malus domestica]
MSEVFSFPSKLYKIVVHCCGLLGWIPVIIQDFDEWIETQLETEGGVTRVATYTQGHLGSSGAVIYTKDELMEVPSEFLEMWACLEGEATVEQGNFLANKVGKIAQGGGSWPSTALSPP